MKLLKIKNILAALTLLVIGFSMISSPVLAAEFLGDDNINTDKVYTNLYAAANDIEINQEIKKDLYAAGNEITVNQNIERNANLAGNLITISESSTIGATLKAAGNKVVIEGDVIEDVFIAAEKVIIKDANIQGDLVVASSNLEIENSSIDGDAYFSTSEKLSDDWSDQIAGEINYDSEYELELDLPDFGPIKWIFKIISIVLSALSLLVLCIFLNKRNRLAISGLNKGKTVLMDFVWGICTILVGVVAVIVSLLVFKISIPFVIITIGIGMFSSIFTPIYVANMIPRNSNQSIALFVFLAWIGLILVNLLSLLPLIGWLIGLALWILSMATFGFLIKSLFNTLNKALEKKEKEIVSE